MSERHANGIATPVQLAPHLRRLLAPNPSPMTFHGTNTYLLGQRDIAVIDPGPLSETHLHAILSAIEPHQYISHIFVTHSHRDHSSLARSLSDATQAPIYAFGDATAGRSEIMTQLAKHSEMGGGEGVDHDFQCDFVVKTLDTVSGSDWMLTCLHTPGHMGNHICLYSDDMLFCGDHVMGWASSLVSPPDGDLTDFMASCEMLRQQTWRVFYPSHGDPILEPNARLDWLIKHRQSRESDIILALKNGPQTITEITSAVYTDVPSTLFEAAQRNILAHLIDLSQRRLILPIESLSLSTRFQLKK